MTNINPGETKTVSAELYATPYRFSSPLKLEGMHAAPGRTNVDPKKIVEIKLFMRTPKRDHAFTIDNVRFETPLELRDPDEFLPFIDRFGQFAHAEWPGKIHSEEELLQAKEQESKELLSMQAPACFNRFGGWKDGQQLEKGKFFRTQKIDDQWWLVDPDGQLFWSHGIDSVAARFGATGITDRESYFDGLPEKGSPLARFYGQSTWAYGFYASRIPFKTYNFLNANLFRKYGDNWRQDFADIAHRRLKSWGINTLGSWADPRICQQSKTPYTAFVHVKKGPVLEGAKRMWTRFHDVFDPGFEQAIVAGISECKFAFGDPWCLGFFVDNELYWGSETDIGSWTLSCPPTQAAKTEFINDLKAKYESIEKLNQSWHTTHEDWDALSESTTPPDVSSARDDLFAFSQKSVRRYFRTVHDALHDVAPDQLYLGCRFIWDNPTAIRAACEHCDVVSFNRYLYSIENLGLPEGCDKPVMIGEFHFGAIDRGAFHPSKVPTANQQQRAACYTNFVRGALKNRLVVGTHWFAYHSEPTAGRGDGENYHIGFVDSCDTPYKELVDAARSVSESMYSLRFDAGQDKTSKD